MVGSKIYENDSHLRAVVGNYRESGAVELKKTRIFFLISPKDPFHYELKTHENPVN